jgi:cytidylate kinase
MIIDGYQGEGKSTLAVEIAEEYQAKDLDFAKQYAVGSDDFKNKFEDCITHGLNVIIYDEAGDFDKYSVMTKQNKMLATFLKTFRVYKILVMLLGVRYLPILKELKRIIQKYPLP